MVALVLERRAELAERRAPDERSAHGRGGAGRAARSRRVDQLRPGHAAARVRLDELTEHGDRSGSGTASGLETSTSSPLVARVPVLTLAA